jgi:hypothetical protein
MPVYFLAVSDLLFVLSPTVLVVESANPMILVPSQAVLSGRYSKTNTLPFVIPPSSTHLIALLNHTQIFPLLSPSV